MTPGSALGSSLAALLVLGAPGVGSLAQATEMPRELVLRLVAGGNGQGEIEPCACPHNSVGGLARRATLLARLRGNSDGLIYATAGDDLGGPMVPEAERMLRAKLILDAERLMQIDLVGLGERDRGLGLELETRALPRSALLKRFWPPVGLVAVDLDEPGAAQWLSREAARLRQEGARLVVALVHGETKRALSFLKQHGRGVDFAVAAHDPAFAARAVAAGPVRVIGPPGQAQQLAVLELHVIMGSLHFVDEKAHLAKPDASWFAVRHLPLGADLPDDPQIAALLRSFRAEVATLPPPPTTNAPDGPLPDAGVFAGAPACGRCHQGAMKLWTTSAHARAWLSLQKGTPGATGNRQHDNKCLACHASSGTFSSTSGRPSVQCEACHGPSALHVVRPREAGHTVRAPGEAVCLPCHRISDHVKEWDYPAALAKILGPGHNARR